MFFPERIQLIRETDRVLEIGPGGTPFPRSDVLLEKNFSDVTEAAWQRGNAPELKTDKKIIFYDGGAFPFRDKEFDYVICSHVLEHIADIEFFVSELFRVAAKGYIEFPTIYYEYLYNIPVHLNLIRFRDDTLQYLPKADTPLSDFELVQALFLESLNKGYTHIVDDLKQVMFQGFEWKHPFPVRKAAALGELVPETSPLKRFTEPALKERVLDAIRLRARSAIGKIRLQASRPGRTG